MAFAGSIRGAIAFGLAISIQTGSVQNDEVLVSTTLVMVFITTIVFGAVLPLVIKYYKENDEELKMHQMKKEIEQNNKEMENGKTNHHKEDTYSHGTFEYTYSHPNNRFE